MSTRDKNIFRNSDSGQVPGANRGVLATVLGEESVKQSLCLSPQGEFSDCSEQASGTVRTQRLSVGDLSTV